MITEDLEARVRHLLGRIGSVRYSFSSESELQQGIELVLKKNKIEALREHRLSPKDKVDFWAWGGIGIEVKIDGSLSALTRQLHRYAQHEDVQALILVTSRSRLENLPAYLNSKPLYTLNLIASKF